MFARNMPDFRMPLRGRMYFETNLDVFPLHTSIFVVKYRQAPIAAGLSTSFEETMEGLWAGSLVEHRSM